VASITNLFIDQGSDYSNIITVESANGVGLDLTNYTVKSQMRKSYTSSIAYDFTTSLYSAPDGEIKLELSAADSELIPPGRYLYDVEITSPTPLFKKTRVVEGIVTVTPQITQV
jgi:hypothetical protein